MDALPHLLHQHDARLVMLAALVSVCGSITAFRLYSRLRGSRGMVRFAWTLLTGFVAGAGAWATHFLAMLAYDTGMPTGYWPAMTMASLMIAVVFTSLGFGVAQAPAPPTKPVSRVQAKRTIPREPRRRE